MQTFKGYYFLLQEMNKHILQFDKVQYCKLLWEVVLWQSLKGEGELLRQSRKKTITLNRHSLEVLIGRNEAPIKYI